MKVSSNVGLLAVRELDQALCLMELAESVLVDTRTGSNVQYPSWVAHSSLGPTQPGNSALRQ